MADKITVDKLNRKLADPKVSRKQLLKYFLPDEERSGLFDPALRLNPEMVEITRTAEERTRSTLALNAANTWARLRRRWTFEAKIAEGYTGPPIVTEGDSWFQYPLLLKDIIYHLSEHYAIRRLDEAGGTLENTVADGEYLEALRETGPAKPHLHRAEAVQHLNGHGPPGAPMLRGAPSVMKESRALRKQCAGCD